MRLFYFIIFSGLALPVFAISWDYPQLFESQRCTDCTMLQVDFNWLPSAVPEWPVKKLSDCAIQYSRLVKIVG